MKSALICVSFVAVIYFAYSVQASEKSDCLLPKEVGPCRKSDEKFYYNTESKECQEFIYGGCHGNGNRFQTKEECEKQCAQG